MALHGEDSKKTEPKINCLDASTQQGPSALYFIYLQFLPSDKLRKITKGHLGVVLRLLTTSSHGTRNSYPKY
jgi:hypothetical protein